MVHLQLNPHIHTTYNPVIKNMKNDDKQQIAHAVYRPIQYGVYMHRSLCLWPCQLLLYFVCRNW